MKILFKALYDFVVDQITLFENPFWNYVSAAIVGTITFSIAWNLVDRLYDAGDIHGRGCGSFVHWTIRILVTVFLFLLISLIIATIRFVLSVSGWVWAIVLLVVGLLLIAFLLVRKRKKRMQMNQGGK